MKRLNTGFSESLRSNTFGDEGDSGVSKGVVDISGVCSRLGVAKLRIERDFGRGLGELSFSLDGVSILGVRKHTLRTDCTGPFIAPLMGVFHLSTLLIGLSSSRESKRTGCDMIRELGVDFSLGEAESLIDRRRIGNLGIGVVGRWALGSFVNGSRRRSSTEKSCFEIGREGGDVEGILVGREVGGLVASIRGR